MGTDVVGDAVHALERGGVVVFPTETVFGLGGRLDRAQAIDRIFTLKGRARDKPLQVLLASAGRVGEVAHLSPDAERLAALFMPGPLTIVLPAREGVPDLGARGSVGVRVPDHPVAVELLEASGPLAATSANRSGQATQPTLDGVRRVFGDAVDAYVDGQVGSGPASSVVSLVEGEPELLREGAIGRTELEAVLGRALRT